MAHHAGAKDFYRILKVSRTSSSREIKEAYRKLAMALHPDKNDGDPSKTKAFKEASEAYNTLSDHSKRTAYDIANGVAQQERKKPPPNYRKVYAPRPPPGFKTFDAERHYNMHYGDGQMVEAMENAIKRAKLAAGKVEYRSPLGPGFSFSAKDVKNSNPFSSNSSHGRRAPELDIEIDYEEAHFHDAEKQGEMNDAHKVVHHRERIRGRLHERRKLRLERRSLSPKRQSNSCTVS